ncbi:hypothetical protein BDK51DRAFT_42217 [Blyttiomyces helicus]|uniref:Major facilitator superfamily domain-containing protein n=1 Tax=Blyttiomyces helicus TaxID=388810 RepID=A0A4P9WEP0_9FUNG|nr:hypothetical protein BDK51DRAFT_42217 [Blyttiomyces helicus]|eukprot:RKO89738.1 hypothetical protein BDK51DRAFT_42217 [Blyttiomyces helicus]
MFVGDRPSRFLHQLARDRSQGCNEGRQGEEVCRGGGVVCRGGDQPRAEGYGGIRRGLCLLGVGLTLVKGRVPWDWVRVTLTTLVALPLQKTRSHEAVVKASEIAGHIQPTRSPHENSDPEFAGNVRKKRRLFAIARRFFRAFEEGVARDGLENRAEVDGVFRQGASGPVRIKATGSSLVHTGKSQVGGWEREETQTKSPYENRSGGTATPLKNTKTIGRRIYPRNPSPASVRGRQESFAALNQKPDPDEYTPLIRMGQPIRSISAPNVLTVAIFLFNFARSGAIGEAFGLLRLGCMSHSAPGAHHSFASNAGAQRVRGHISEWGIRFAACRPPSSSPSSSFFQLRWERDEAFRNILDRFPLQDGRYEKKHYAETNHQAPYDCSITAVQSVVAQFSALLVLLTLVPSVFSALLLGGLSDPIGGKPVLIVSATPTILNLVIINCVAAYGVVHDVDHWPSVPLFCIIPQISLDWILFGVLLSGLGGSGHLIVTVLVSALVDVTVIENRTFWFGFNEAVNHAGSIAGLFVVTALTKPQNYSNIDITVYLPAIRFALITALIAMAIITVCLPETLVKPEPVSHGVDQKEGPEPTEFSWAHIRVWFTEEIAKFKPVPWLPQVTIMIIVIVGGGRQQIIFLWTFNLWKWGAFLRTAENSYYSAASSIGVILCYSAVVPLIQPVLESRIKDPASYSLVPSQSKDAGQHSESIPKSEEESCIEDPASHSLFLNQDADAEEPSESFPKMEEEWTVWLSEKTSAIVITAGIAGDAIVSEDSKIGGGVCVGG